MGSDEGGRPRATQVLRHGRLRDALTLGQPLLRFTAQSARSQAALAARHAVDQVVTQNQVRGDECHLGRIVAVKPGAQAGSVAASLVDLVEGTAGVVPGRAVVDGGASPRVEAPHIARAEAESAVDRVGEHQAHERGHAQSIAHTGEDGLEFVPHRGPERLDDLGVGGSHRERVVDGALGRRSVAQLTRSDDVDD